jgi:hypothetical protein
MTFSDAAIAEFIAIWNTELGDDLTPDAARVIALRLMTLHRLLRGSPRKHNPSPPQ